ncbi:rhomboid family intramembrane serine protease [bacterium]|nr:rhomboid family intramembrane serine protease [bacterium]
MSSTYIIIGVTAVVSFMAFNNMELKYKLLFYPWKINSDREWYRFVTSGLVHADMMHLFFNMFTLFFFGPYVEHQLARHGGFMPETKFWLLYFGSMVMGSMFSYFKNQDNPNYMALGASGAVSGVLFSSIIFDPWMKLYLFAAIPIPGILFGVGYLFYSAKMAREARDNIGHDAHLYGAIFGVLITIAYNPTEIFPTFLGNLLDPHF